MIRWTGLAPWDFAFPFPGNLATYHSFTQHIMLLRTTILLHTTQFCCAPHNFRFVSQLLFSNLFAHTSHARSFSQAFLAGSLVSRGVGCRRWRFNPSGKCSQERLTRGTVTSTMRRAAHPEGSTSFWMCKVRCWRWLFGNKIPISGVGLRHDGASTLNHAP